jgi:hypothetical protein
MNVSRTAKSWMGIVLAVLLLLGLAASALAQVGGDYDLTWSTIDGGGYTFSSGGDYELSGTVGQPDAGVMTGGDFTLGGGFWGGGQLSGQVVYNIYLPLVARQFP